jgi:hypothetical protein
LGIRFSAHFFEESQAMNTLRKIISSLFNRGSQVAAARGLL